MKRGYADTPRGQIHYTIAGAGETLLLLHQTPRSGTAFARMLPLLAKRFRCIAADTLGFGNSDPLPRGARMEDLAESMVHLLDRLKIARAHVFGLHTGNKIGAALAAGWPKRVSRVVLAGQTHSLIDDKKKRDAAILDIVRGYMARHGKAPDGAHLVRPWAAIYGHLAEAWWDPAVHGKDRLGEDDLRYLADRAIDLIRCRRDIAAIYKMNFAFDLGGALRHIAAPTLIVELCTPEEEHLKRQGPGLVRVMRAARLVTLENANGEALEFRARDLTRATSAFLKRRG